jgi:hypothetical protein
MSFDYRTRRFGAVALGVTFLGGIAIGSLTVNPAAAAGIISAVTTVSCSVTGSNWCISGNNSSSGLGVIGTSKSGTGLRGTSTSQYGLKATSGSGTAIMAQTTSGPSAITAVGSTAAGAYGVNASGGTAIYGTATSANGAGVRGTTSSGNGYGTYGSELNGVGAYGYSGSGVGVAGDSEFGAGGAFTSASGYGISVKTGDPLEPSTTAVYAQNTNGHGADVQGSDIGLISRAPAGGYPLVLINTSGNDVFNVDGSGDVYYKGTLNHVTATVGGGAVRSFSPNATQPTAEDTGTAQLVGGVAVVRLDPAFAASIEPSAAYRVFVTPNGDTRGLFVAAKTAAGFVVRESQAGRSTVTFDYRIVATALGGAGQHMAILSPAAARALAPRAPQPVVPARRAPPPLPTPAVEPATP